MSQEGGKERGGGKREPEDDTERKEEGRGKTCKYLHAYTQTKTHACALNERHTF